MWKALRSQLGSARFDLAEASGALGDLGTFLPLALAMARQNGLDFGVGLFLAGVLNLLTGLCFALPMAVQPMKAIAAVALTQNLSLPQILAAGMLVGALIGLLGAMGLTERLSRWIPDPVVRGLQLALGLSLALKGFELILASGPDRFWLALPAFLAGWLLWESRRVPLALILFLAGCGLAMIRHPEALSQLRLGLHLPHRVPIARLDWAEAFWKAALPQVPLTLLNSVVAVCALSRDLFPDRAPTERRVALSVGAMNLLTGWFGGMPMCHGAGGLAGQARFGARTQGSILLLGGAKVAVAVAFGSSLMALAQAFPQALLGVMLAFSGLSLAQAARKSENVPVLLLTCATCLGLGYPVGVLAGWAASAMRRR